MENRSIFKYPILVRTDVWMKSVFVVEEDYDWVSVSGNVEMMIVIEDTYLRMLWRCTPLYACRID